MTASNRPARWLVSIAALSIACLSLAACGGGDGGASLDIRDRPELEIYDNEHTTNQQIHLAPGQSADYTAIPPYGEEHSPIPLTCGIYSATPTFEMVVHALEHGAVAIWYSPDDLNADELAALTEISADHLNDNDYVIQAPYGGLESPLMLISWGVRLPLDTVEHTAIEQFFDEFHNEAPEPLAAGGCVSAR